MPAEEIATARSFLFVPGDRPERFAKALASEADQVIVDLEDAVAHDRKGEARAALRAWLSPERPVLVRVNAVGTAEFGDDIQACNHPGVAGIVLSKAEAVADLVGIRQIAPDALLLPLVESAKGLNAATVLASCLGVVRLMFGSIDFQLDLEIPEEGEPLAAFRSHLVLASRLGGAASPVDGVTVDMTNPATLASDVARGRAFGFGGKLCIHPNQVPVVNEGFVPTSAEVAWAQNVMAAVSAAAGSGAIALNGAMIDRPVILKAERLLRRARATTKRVVA